MAKVVKKKKFLNREELEHLDKSELVDRILQLEAHNLQLKQIIEKRLDTSEKTKAESSKKKFDFTKCQKRHIFLKFYYLGWDYQGYAAQEDTTSTIEYYLFVALMKSCLIECRETSNYHRCGRTDKGVSAFSQVISLDIRSRLEPEKQDNLLDELPYCKILNRLLPKNIRCIAWSPVSPESSARFDCKWRSYKYFFPRGNLNIDAMNKAVKHTIGNHDFRNLCKMDVANGVVNFSRNIIDAEVICTSNDSNNKNTGYDMCELSIKSNAFLWHQIRCIMGILLLVGREQEKPEIVKELLDIEKCPRKPQYNLAHYIPLNLFYCEYNDTNWYTDKEELQKVVKDLQEEWCYSAIKCTMTRTMLKNMETLFHNETSNFNYQSDRLLQGVEPKVYRPLMQRETCVFYSILNKVGPTGPIRESGRPDRALHKKAQAGKNELIIKQLRRAAKQCKLLTKKRRNRLVALFCHVLGAGEFRQRVENPGKKLPRLCTFGSLSKVNGVIRRASYNLLQSLRAL